MLMFGIGTQYVAQADLELTRPLWLHLCTTVLVLHVRKISSEERASERMSFLLLVFVFAFKTGSYNSG